MSAVENAPVAIFSYTREQALADGVLVDVSKLAREAGIKYPCAVSEAVWARYCEDRHEQPTQDVTGRTWDIVWMLRCAIRRTNGGDEVAFKLHVAMPDGDWRDNEDHPEKGSSLRRDTHRLVTLKALCGPGDDGEPVVTIMLPGED